ISPHVLLPQHLLNLSRACHRNCQEAANRVIPRTSGQNFDLMLIQLAQFRGCELLLLEELEHSGGAVVARKVVRRARKPRRARSIRHASTRARATEIGEFAEPPRYDGPQIGVLRKSQE